MSGYVGNDGSQLAGGLNPSGAVKALSVDASGNLNVNASVSSGPTNITQVSSANVGPTNGLPVSGNNSGALAVIAVDSSGRLILVPNTAFNMAQIAGIAPGLDNTNELRVSAYGKNAAAGDTPLLVDSSGRPLVSVAQINGQAPTLDNTSILATSMRGKGTVAGDTALWLESTGALAGGVVTQDIIRRATIAGYAYSATTGKLTAPGAATLGFQLFNPASGTKNILIYSLIIANVGGGLHQFFKTAANVNSITGWTDVACSITNNGANATASTATSSYSNTNVTGGLLGTAREVPSQGANNSVEVLTNGECIWLPAGAAAIAGIALYFNASGTNAWGITCEYLEF